MGRSVLQVVTSAERRGAEVFAVELGECLRTRGWTVRTVALHSGRGDLDIPTLGRAALSATTLIALRREAQRCDVVVAHGSSTLPACALALGATNTPFVYRNIGDPTYWSATAFRRYRTAGLLWRAAAVAALSTGAAAALHRRYWMKPDKISVIPTGVSGSRHRPADRETRARSRRTLGLHDTDRVVANVGALSHEKGVDLMIDAMSLLPEVSTLLLVGDGPERNRLEERAHATAPGRVRFLGNLADPAIAYEAADVVVLPSRTEGLPAVLIEAGFRALPVVAADVGYVRDIVLDGGSGALVPPEDAHALADGVRGVLNYGSDPGTLGRAYCLAHFELGHVANQWSDLLRRVIRVDR